MAGSGIAAGACALRSEPSTDREREKGLFADALLCAVLMVGALVVYVKTLAPTVTGEDSGTLIAAAYCLGIPHPPGYPLYTVLAHVFALLPVGTVAWRVNLFSAVCAAVTTGGVFLWLRRCDQRRIAAAAAASVFAFSAEFWEQAVIAEVYTLNALFTVLAFILAVEYRHRRQAGWLYALSFVCGLGMANHHSMIVVAAVLALFLSPQVLQAHVLRQVIVVTGCLLPGLAFYLYLPLRSFANPPMDWGNPETWANFWAVILRRQFVAPANGEAFNFVRFAQQLFVLLRFWPEQFTVWLSALTLVGLLGWLRTRTYDAIMFLTSGLAVWVAAVWIQDFDMQKEWLWVMSVFAIPFYLAVTPGLGWALERLFRYCRHGAFVFLLVACAVLSPLVWHYRADNKSEYYWARDYAENLLATLPQGAYFVPETDHGCFPLRYLQIVEGIRPDIVVVRKYGYLDVAAIPGLTEEVRIRVGNMPRRKDEPELLASLLQHAQAPVYVARIPHLPEGVDVRFVRQGLLYRALRRGEEPAEPSEEIWRRYRWHTLSREDTHGDYTAELILCEIHLGRAEEAFSAGKKEEALKEVRAALEVYGPDVHVWNNAAVLCARYGAYDEAEGLWKQAMAWGPNQPVVRQNLRHLQERKKQDSH